MEHASTGPAARLLAISDLHVGYPDNRAFIEQLEPGSEGDWLLLAGDVGEIMADVEWALRTLSSRFATVVWVPGNHELWSHPEDPVRLRGVRRYQHLVQYCRGLGVVTPEDPYPVWPGPDGPVTIAPLFLLYDYTFRPPGASTKEEALAIAYDSGVVCSDEMLLHPDPFPTREAWCRDRVERTRRRLSEVDPSRPLVLVNHWPLTREPTDVLRFPQFAQWCGTELTADWHTRFDAAAVVYGHLHIPRVTWQDGVRFVEASVGYPREWKRRGPRPGVPEPGRPRQVFPVPEHDRQAGEAVRADAGQR
jgi:3',5'-cyclic AMP phosphodiesterase CpdA